MELDLPAKAIETYEKSTGYAVTLHHVDKRLWSILPPLWSWHGSVACRAVKQFDDHACTAFDLGQVRERLAAQPAGFVKICHGGLVEWVVGIADISNASKDETFGTPGSGGEACGGGLAMVLFSGQALPGDDLATVEPLVAAGPRAGHGLPVRARLRRVDAAEARLQLELLAQLGARLEQWLGAMARQGHLGEGPGPESSAQIPQAGAMQLRRRRIETFIRARHAQPVTIDDLAQELGLSPGRAAHVVTQTLGSSFGKLLLEARLRTAASLLGHTPLSVLEVALRSGFGDVSHFHRCFRKSLGVTPLVYRKRVEVLTPLTISI